MPATSLQGGHKCIMALRSGWSRQAQGVSRYMADISWDKTMNTINNLRKLSRSQEFKTNPVWAHPVVHPHKAGTITFTYINKKINVYRNDAIHTCTDLTSTLQSASAIPKRISFRPSALLPSLANFKEVCNSLWNTWDRQWSPDKGQSQSSNGSLTQICPLCLMWWI